MLSYFQKQDIVEDYKELFSQAEEDGIKVDAEMYEKAKNGVGEGFYKMGDGYYNRGTTNDYQKAMIWYKIAGQKGYAAGANDVGHLHMLGLGTDINYTLAMENYLKAAELKLPMGMYNTGYMYRFGLGVDVNYPLAMEWLNKAMDQGSEFAPNLLGLMYLHGFGVDVDYKRAMRLFIKAKEGGSTEAPYNIGTMYEKGLGVSVDYLTALEWYTVSVERGYSKAKAAVEVLEENGYSLKEQVPEEIVESEKEGKEKKQKRKENLKAMKTIMSEDETEKQELIQRVIVLEDNKRKMNEKIKNYQIESDGLFQTIEHLKETLETLTAKLSNLKKVDYESSSTVNISEDDWKRQE